MNWKKILGVTVLGVALGLGGCKKVNKERVLRSEEFHLDTRLYSGTVLTDVVGTGHWYDPTRRAIYEICAFTKPAVDSDYTVLWPNKIRAVDYDLDGQFDRIDIEGQGVKRDGPLSMGHFVKDILHPKGAWITNKEHPVERNNESLERIAKDFWFLYKQEYGPECKGTIKRGDK